MARPNQKQISLYVDIQIHKEIKRNARLANLTIKDYVLNLHHGQEITRRDLIYNLSVKLHNAEKKMQQLIDENEKHKKQENLRLMNDNLIASIDNDKIINEKMWIDDE